ncbi:MAG: DUF1552 domain-containing protein [Pirellulales bacterium]
MPQPSWRLDRRTFLHGTGLALALPWLEAMTSAASPSPEKPKRFCAFFFGNGVALSKPTDPTADWNWFPRTDGPEYQFTRSLETLADHKQNLTIFGQLSHPTSRQLVGHNTGDVWLTGADIRLNLNNSISLDQLIARQYGLQTRIPSLVLSSNGGTGMKSRATTISFDQQGRAIPAESNPRSIFERLFEKPADGDLVARERALAAGRKRVDFLLDDARSLRHRLGRPDQQRLDEFLSSLSEVESRLTRAQSWLGKAVPAVDRSQLNLEVSQKGPTDYIRTMMDLIVLAFETDTSRVATYQISSEDGHGICDRFPGILKIGTGKHGGHHGLSHSNPSQDSSWGEYDRYLAEQFAYFLTRLSAIREGETTVLDRTLALFGSGTSNTHNARNYPMVLAGGKDLGFRHGRFIKAREERPLGDLYVTMLQRLDFPVQKFADNAGEFSEVVS